MEFRRLIIVSTFILLVSSLTVAYDIQPSREAPSTIIVPDDYSTIQAAINAANPGDTIAVRNGTYAEGIVVNKTVSLLGESKETTIILGAGLDPYWQSVISVEASYVTVSGFKILDSTYQSIWVKTSDNTIKDNIIEGGEWEGILLDGRTGQVNRNTIVDNYITGKDDCGIVLLGGSSFNLIKSNVITRNFFGIYLFGPSDTYNIIAENQVTNNSDLGIGLEWDSSNNTIVGNNITDNGWMYPLSWDEVYYMFPFSLICSGIFVEGSSSNQFVANSIVHNQIGIRLNAANDNTIFHNNLVNNFLQVYNRTDYPCMNVWDSGYPSGGNFWSNYTGSDLLMGPYQNVTGSDGIGDISYIIDNYNRDRYPLMTPYSLQLLQSDLNFDLKVDIKDLAIAAEAFGSYPGHPKWNPVADLNQDDKVDIRDLVAIAKSYGKQL